MKHLIRSLLLTVSIGLVGCATHPPRCPPQPIVPADARVIGGGYRVFYIAPVEGTFYVVDQPTGLLLTSWHRKKGDLFEIIPSTFTKIAQALDMPLKDLKPVVYFAPRR